MSCKKGTGKGAERGNRGQNRRQEKEDKADEKKDEKPKDIVVELKGIQDRILRLTLLIPPKWVVPSSQRMARPYIISRLSKTNTTCGKWTCARKRPSYPQDEYRMGEHGNG